MTLQRQHRPRAREPALRAASHRGGCSLRTRQERSAAHTLRHGPHARRTPHARAARWRACQRARCAAPPWRPLHYTQHAIADRASAFAAPPVNASQGLADYQAKLMNAKDDYEKAAAQVGIEVCSAMNSALGG